MTRAARSRATYVVLAILVIVLSLYMALRQRDRMQYTIPTLDSLDKRQIDALEIERAAGAVKIVRSGEIWQIQPEGYKVDVAAIEEMLNTVSELQLTELVSVTGDYSRYELDRQSRIRVTVFDGGEVLRRFDLGKGSPTYNHTFVRIDGDERVFQTPGNPGSVFGLSSEELRDRLVMSFDPETITEIRAEGPGWTLHLIRSLEDSTDEGDHFGAVKQLTWREQSGKVWDEGKIKELVNILSDLKAFRFREQGDRDGEPVLSITLIGNKPYTLEVFARQDGTYPARFSESEYPFALFYEVTENIINLLEGNGS